MPFHDLPPNSDVRFIDHAIPYVQPVEIPSAPGMIIGQAHTDTAHTDIPHHDHPGSVINFHQDYYTGNHHYDLPEARYSHGDWSHQDNPHDDQLDLKIPWDKKNGIASDGKSEPPKS